MKKKTLTRRFAAMILAMVMLLGAVPTRALSGGTTVTTTPARQFCGAYIRLSGTDYLCAVDLGAPIIDSASDTVMTAGTTVRLELFFSINDAWYACRKQEMQGDPDSLFTVSFTKTQGGDRISQPVWKTYPDDGYGERYYLEFVILGSDTEEPVDVSVALTQPDVPNVGAEYRIVGTMGQKEPCVAPISIGGTVYDCTVDLQGYLTSTGDDGNMIAGSTVCFPLMFLGGDGVWYPVLASELQGDPDRLFTVSEAITSGNMLLTRGGWKTWENGHYYLEYTVADSQYETPLQLTVQLKQDEIYRQGKAVTFSGTAPASENPAWRQCVVSISIGGAVYECIVDLQGYLTSSGSDTLKGGGSVTFPLMFLGGDGQWYPVLASELQGTPDDLLNVQESIVSGGELLTATGWKTWENGHYYLEYRVSDAEYETKVDFSVKLTQPASGKYGEPVQFVGVVPESEDPVWKTCRVPIRIDGTVYDCIVDLQGYLTSSGSDTLKGGGTVAFPLMFLGGDGVWYPVLKGELQGTPEELLTVTETVSSGAKQLKKTGWKTWDNGHYYMEFEIRDPGVETNVKFTVQLSQSGGKAGTPVTFSGKVPAAAAAAPVQENTYCIVPIKIGGVVYNCIVDLRDSLTSSGSATLEGGGTVAFPLMFMGEDGTWYPVLKEELQGDPENLFTHTLRARSGGELLTCTGWGTWESGHYYLEYKVSAPKETTKLDFGVVLNRSGVNGIEDRFTGYAQPGADISGQQIPMKPSAALVVERIEECQEFNTLSFTIDGVRYNDGWPVDFESPNTTSAVITDGTIIRADLCFMVNGQWYPVRQQECNESVEELLTYDYQVLSGGEFLGVPRFTTRYDAYGDIWQFEVAVTSEEEGEFVFTLQLASKDGTKTGSKYKVTGRVQSGEMTSTVEELPEERNSFLWIILGGVLAVAVIALIPVLILRKKKTKNG